MRGREGVAWWWDFLFFDGLNAQTAAAAARTCRRSTQFSSKQRAVPECRRKRRNCDQNWLYTETLTDVYWFKINNSSATIGPVRNSTHFQGRDQIRLKGIHPLQTSSSAPAPYLFYPVIVRILNKLSHRQLFPLIYKTSSYLTNQAVRKELMMFFEADTSAQAAGLWETCSRTPASLRKEWICLTKNQLSLMILMSKSPMHLWKQEIYGIPPAGEKCIYFSNPCLHS